MLGETPSKRVEDYWNILPKAAKSQIFLNVWKSFDILVLFTSIFTYSYRIHVTSILSLLGIVGGGDRVHRGGYMILPSPPTAHFTAPNGGKVALGFV